MLARRLPTILPSMTLEEALETTRIHSVAGLLGAGQSLCTVRPFRAPHHTVSDAGLIGGGSPPRPGRGQPGPRRSALPRRAAGVPAQRAGGAAPAAGGRDGHPEPRGYEPDLSRAVHAGRGDEPLSLRLPGRPGPRLPLRADRRSSATGPACPGRCWTGSTSTWRCRRCAYRDLVGGAARGVRAPPSGPGWSGPARSSGSASATGPASTPTPTWLRATSGATVRLSAPVEALLRDAVNRLGLSARAYHRVLKIARTIADLGRIGRPGDHPRQRGHPVSKPGSPAGSGVAGIGCGGCMATQQFAP